MFLKELDKKYRIMNIIFYCLICGLTQEHNMVILTFIDKVQMSDFTLKKHVSFDLIFLQS